MQDKVKNWEELCNDGENYGGEGENLSPKEKILFENNSRSFYKNAFSFDLERDLETFK